MEDVVFTSPPTNPNSAEKGPPSNQTASISDPSLNGLAASMHAPKPSVKGKEKEVSISDNIAKSPQKIVHDGSPSYDWKVVTTKRTFPIFFPYENIPGDSAEAKKKAIFNLIGQIDGFINLEINTISTTKYVKSTFDSEEHAAAALTKQFPKISNVHFISKEQVIQKTATSAGFQLKIHDLPLDIDKPLFLEFLNTFDKVTSIKYQVRSLYYQCIVTFASATTNTKFGWSLIYGKNAFRCYPSNLTKEQFEHRRKFGLKLTNLPKGTSAFELLDIVKEAKGLTCFIPRRQDEHTYQKERFAYVQFKSETDMNAALPTAYKFKGRAIYWVTANTKTCNFCGSHLHLQKRCKEANRTIQQVERNNRFARIYSHFGATPPQPRDFRLIARDQGWDDWSPPTPTVDLQSNNSTSR